jgi:hypothetical protein
MRDIFFERSRRVRIPYPAYFFDETYFIDIIIGSAILLIFRWRFRSVSLKYMS